MPATLTPPPARIPQVQAQLRNDASSASTVDDCIQLWTKVLVADSARADRVADNVAAMQRESIAMLELLAQYLEALGHGHVPPSPSLDPRQRRGAERERASALDSSSSHPRHARIAPVSRPLVAEIAASVNLANLGSRSVRISHSESRLFLSFRVERPQMGCGTCSIDLGSKGRPPWPHFVFFLHHRGYILSHPD